MSTRHHEPNLFPERGVVNARITANRLRASGDTEASDVIRALLSDMARLRHDHEVALDRAAKAVVRWMEAAEIEHDRALAAEDAVATWGRRASCNQTPTRPRNYRPLNGQMDLF